MVSAIQMLYIYHISATSPREGFNWATVVAALIAAIVALITAAMTAKSARNAADAAKRSAEATENAAKEASEASGAAAKHAADAAESVARIAASTDTFVAGSTRFAAFQMHKREVYRDLLLAIRLDDDADVESRRYLESRFDEAYLIAYPRLQRILQEKREAAPIDESDLLDAMRIDVDDTPESAELRESEDSRR